MQQPRQEACRCSQGDGDQGAWVAQSVKRPTSAQVMGSSPTLGSVLTAQSLEPASDSVSPSLFLPTACSRSLSLSLSL